MMVGMGAWDERVMSMCAYKIGQENALDKDIDWPNTLKSLQWYCYRPLFLMFI